GTLNGTAVTTNNALILDGASGTFVNLPGGLVSGSPATTVEFWADFGTNPTGNRVCAFSFGRTTSGAGQQMLMFSPHNAAESNQLTLFTSGGTADISAPGPLDGQAVHVVCIVDPSNSYSAIYTNGVLESSR